MKAEDKRRVLDLYGGRFKEFGYDVRTVGWSNQSDQRLRFAVLCRDVELSGRRILDVGCGLGDFVGFLDERGVRDFDYLGIDIVPDLVREARQRFGDDPRRRFAAADFLDDEQFGEFDVVVSSGALSLRISDNPTIARQSVAKMFGLCRQMAAVNFLSTYVDYQTPKNFHYEPEVMFTYVRSLTPWVRIYHDYPLYEFTLQLFREPNVCQLGTQS